MLDIQERLTAFAMLGAGWVMWLLVLLSVIGLGIILERAYYLMSSRDNGARLQEDLRRLLAGGDVPGAQKRMKASRSFEARVVEAGLDAASRGPEVAQESMAGATKLARSAMERNLAFLGTVGNNAPFVGLLGTVIGVIRAFHALNQSAGQVSAGLMTEIGEALVATAIGILVALPAVAFYNFYQRVIRFRLTWADALGHDVLAHLKGGRSTPAASGKD